MVRTIRNSALSVEAGSNHVEQVGDVGSYEKVRDKNLRDNRDNKNEERLKVKSERES